METCTAIKPEKRKLRWYQYSLRSVVLMLLLLVLVVSIFTSWVAVRMQRAKRQRAAVEAIVKLGGKVTYNHGRTPVWPLKLLGDDFWAHDVFVNLANTQVTDMALEHLQGLTQLNWLALNHTPVTDSGMERLKGLNRLQALSLDNTQVTDAALIHLKGLPQLESLSLQNTQVTDAALRHLEEFTQLRCLRVQHTKVTDEGVKQLQRVSPNCTIFIR